MVFVAPSSQLKYLIPGSSGFDAALIDWARRYVRADAVVWDIGANCGIFALAAAGLGASVLAVEPDPFLAPHLEIEILAAAVDKGRGVATLQIASGGRAANALSAYAGNYVPFGRSIGAVRVPTLSLDDLLEISVPALVKIDIEGAEIAALNGATRLLNEVRPVILLEIASEVWDEGVAIFTAAGYRLSDPKHPEIEAKSPLFNVLATPAELCRHECSQ